jgi:hypothetical protein
MQRGVMFSFVFASVLLAFLILDLGVDAFLALISFLLSLTFSFGSTVTAMWQCLMVIFVVAPFKNGDFIVVDGRMHRILEVSLWSTKTVTILEGKLYYLSNAKMWGKDVTNASEGKLGVKTVDVTQHYYIDAPTSPEKLREFQRQMILVLQKDRAENGRDWVAENFLCTLVPEGIQRFGNNPVKLSCNVLIRGIAWAPYAPRWAARLHFAIFCRENMEKLGIKLTMLAADLSEYQKLK